MIGIDEVGRGAWAGPLLVVAVRPIAKLSKSLDDSKKLTKTYREALIQDIKNACEIGEGWVSASEIDAIGLSKAMKLAVKRALTAISATGNEEIVMDGNINYCDPLYVDVTCVIGGDAKHPEIMAASVYAKVIRDKKMAELAKAYPEYGFESHVGYGTKRHIDALNRFGVSKIHRLSYKPVRLVYESNQQGSSS